MKPARKHESQRMQFSPVVVETPQPNPAVEAVVSELESLLRVKREARQSAHRLLQRLNNLPEPE